MSIIADALKKAQRRGQQRVAAPPPFDLKGEGRSPVEAPEKRPPVIPKAAQPKTAPTATGAPRPVPVRAGAPARKGATRLWSVQIPVIFASILIITAAVLFYINKIYLPSLRKSQIALTQPAGQSSQANPQASATEKTGQPAETPGEPSPAAEKAGEKAESVTKEVAKVVTPSGKEPTLKLTAPEKEPAIPLPAEEKEPVNIKPGPVKKPALTAASGGTAPSAIKGAGNLAGRESEPGTETIPPDKIQAQVEEKALFEKEETKKVFDIVQRGQQEEKSLRQDIYHFNMAVFFQRKNDYGSALAEYEKVIELSPYNAEVYSNMGAIYNQIGDSEKAVAVLQKALLIDPNYSKVYNNLGLAYYQSGQLDQAKINFLKAIELEPKNLESLNNLGLLYNKMEDREKAEEAFASALAINPNYAAAHYNLALLCEETGQLEMAIEHYRTFLENGGGTPELNEKVKMRLARLSQPQPATPARF